jgi:glycosyltransferase involved in cell wall biosynthesis
MFSIYILTHNEELDIAACIESAMLSDDVIVVDSCSSDRTVELASHYPVRVVQHPFESHGKQRTWMLEAIPAKHPWVYILEADERMISGVYSGKPNSAVRRLLRCRARDVSGSMDSP